MPCSVATGQQLHRGVALGRAAFVDVQMRGLRADHCLERAREHVERGDVGTGAVEDGPGSRPLAEVALEQSLLRARVQGSEPYEPA